MPKKKSVKLACDMFLSETANIKGYPTTLPQQRRSWAYEYAIIRLYREFEQLILQALIGAVNNDTTTIQARSGIQFPRHLSDEVCEYLIVGDGYFDLRGRSGLISTLKSFVPDGHYLVDVCKDARFKDHLERLFAFRNYAAHASKKSKLQAKGAAGQVNMTSAGFWLGTQDRFEIICDGLARLATELKGHAPY